MTIKNIKNNNKRKDKPVTMVDQKVAPKYEKQTQNKWLNSKMNHTYYVLSQLSLLHYNYSMMLHSYMLTNIGFKTLYEEFRSEENMKTCSIFKFLYLNSFRSQQIDLSQEEKLFIFRKTFNIQCNITLLLIILRFIPQQSMTSHFYIQKAIELLLKPTMSLDKLYIPEGNFAELNVHPSSLTQNKDRYFFHQVNKTHKGILLYEKHIKPFNKTLKHIFMALLDPINISAYNILKVSDFTLFNTEDHPFKDVHVIEFLTRKYIMHDPLLPSIAFDVIPLNQLDTYMHDLKFLYDICFIFNILNPELYRLCSTNRFNLSFNAFISANNISRTTFSTILNILDSYIQGLLYTIIASISARFEPDLNVSSLTKYLLGNLTEEQIKASHNLNTIIPPVNVAPIKIPNVDIVSPVTPSISILVPDTIPHVDDTPNKVDTVLVPNTIPKVEDIPALVPDNLPKVDVTPIIEILNKVETVTNTIPKIEYIVAPVLDDNIKV